jgi:hypothetical protein
MGSSESTESNKRLREYLEFVKDMRQQVNMKYDYQDKMEQEDDESIENDGRYPCQINGPFHFLMTMYYSSVGIGQTVSQFEEECIHWKGPLICTVGFVID